MVIADDGVGIFKKIQTELNLLDERHAVLELSKGKLTTDPARHTGEGIFFTSRMFDSFDILSGGVYFTHQYGQAEDWILERELPGSGTAVWMKLHNHTSRTLKKVFDQYSSGPDEYRFNRTVVPANLARYGDDQLISRSQAKRLLARVELFQAVVFDFKDVPTIWQAFADEIFRVFALEHPDIELIPINANSEVKRMIARAQVRGRAADRLLALLLSGSLSGEPTPMAVTRELKFRQGVRLIREPLNKCHCEERKRRRNLGCMFSYPTERTAR